jgi:proteasome assembly chaperone 3
MSELVSSSSSLSGGFPLEVKASVELNGLATEILCTSFDDRLCVLITQINKVGSLLTAWADSKSDGGYLYHIDTILGRRDDPLLTIYARQIVEKITPHTKKPVLLGISLKEEGRSREHFQLIMNKVLEIIVW